MMIFFSQGILFGGIFIFLVPWKVYFMFDYFCRGSVLMRIFRANHQGFVHWSTEKEGCALKKPKVCLWSVRVACPVPLEFSLGSMVRSGLLTVIYDLYWWCKYIYICICHFSHFTADNQWVVYCSETANLQSFISESMVDVKNLPWSLRFQLVGYHIIAITVIAKQVGANNGSYNPHESKILPCWELTCHVTKPLVKMIFFFPRCDMLVP